MSPSQSRSRFRPYMAAASDPWALVLAGCAIALGLAITLLSPSPSAGAQSGPVDSAEQSGTVHGQVAVTPGADEDQDVLDGTVFDDRNRNSQQDRGESGIAGIEVSNGSDSVTTDDQGRYEIPVHDGQSVFISAPQAWQIPVDADGVAQFSYTHAPNGLAGSEHGSTTPTGPLPDAVDFPLAGAEG